MKTVKPIISNIWHSAKNSVGKTKAKPILDNQYVSVIEINLVKVSEHSIAKMENLLQNTLLPREIEYLENEIKKAKSRLKK